MSQIQKIPHLGDTESLDQEATFFFWGGGIQLIISFKRMVKFFLFFLLITYSTTLVNRLQMSPGHTFLEREKH